jgi:hypothetical protein
LFQLKNVTLVYLKVGEPMEKIGNDFWAAVTEPEQSERQGLGLPDQPHQQMQPVARFRDGSCDLAAVVVDPLGFDSADRTRAIELLDSRFVRTIMDEWRILWAPRHTNTLVIPTYIDVVADPIVPLLRAWIANGNAECEPPPAYPVASDERPSEVVPDMFRAMDLHVMPVMEAAGLRPALERMDMLRPSDITPMQAYQATDGMPVTPAAEPCAERLRQWRRLPSEMTYKQIVDALGWNDVEKDANLVHAITSVLMRRQCVTEGMWCTKRNRLNFWKWSVCMEELRQAAILVARLRLGGAKLDWLPSHIRSA